MTDKQRTILVSLSHGDWVQGHMLANSGQSLMALERLGHIRRDFDHHRAIEALWSITPEGIAALEASK